MLPTSALLYAEGALANVDGKTAHGLLRRSTRFNVLGVIDSTHAGADAGDIIDHLAHGVPVFASVEKAVDAVRSQLDATAVLVIGLETASGKLTAGIRSAARTALRLGLSVVNPLPDLMSSDPELVWQAHDVQRSLIDLRAPPPSEKLHNYTGRIQQVAATRVAVLGTDSAVGKRTTAWCLLDGLNAAGLRTELVGTGQTAYLQGVRFGVVLDAIVNNYVPGELEHAIHSAWISDNPDLIVIEGQGSLLSPAYPESQILVVARPTAVILQHALARDEYLDSGGVRMHDVRRHVEAILAVGGCPVVAVTVNPDGLAPVAVAERRRSIELLTGLPTVDVLSEGTDVLVTSLIPLLPKHLSKNRRDTVGGEE